MQDTVGAQRQPPPFQCEAVRSVVVHTLQQESDHAPHGVNGEGKQTIQCIQYTAPIMQARS
jgi:hypothetical protein